MIYKEKPKDFVHDIECVGCLVEYGDKILLLHRLDHKIHGGKWGLPAGKIDKGDKDPKECNGKGVKGGDWYYC